MRISRIHRVTMRFTIREHRAILIPSVSLPRRLHKLGMRRFYSVSRHPIEGHSETFRISPDWSHFRRLWNAEPLLGLTVYYICDRYRRHHLDQIWCHAFEQTPEPFSLDQFLGHIHDAGVCLRMHHRSLCL